MKILIIKLGAIGDIVHTLPALSHIRKNLPDADITWVAEARSAQILRGNQLINDLIEIDTADVRGLRSIDRILPEFRRQLSVIRRKRYDVALDFQGLIKSAVVSKISGAPRRWGFSRADLREPAARVIYTDTVKVPENTHIIRKNILLAGTALDIGLHPETIEFPIFTDEAARSEADEIARKAGGDFALLNPAGGWETKLWGAENFGRLADILWEEHKLIPIICVGPKEAALANAAMQNASGGKAFIAYPSLPAFYELAKKAQIYIGGDTGPTHLAAAAGTPIVGIFGPTEWWRNGSLNPDDICLERTDIGCRADCHRRTCSNWICMDIAPDDAAAAVRERLSRARQVRASI